MLEILSGAVAADALAAAFAVSAYALSSTLFRGEPRLVRWLGAMVAAGFLASLEFHALAWCHAFALVPGVVVSAAVAAVLVCAGPGIAALRSSLAQDLRWLRRVFSVAARSPERWVTAAAAAMVAIVTLHSLLLPPLGWDSLVYHAVKAGLWVQHAGDAEMNAPGPWGLYRTFWGGAEVFTAWAMLPFHGDTLAMAAQAAFWIGLGFSLFVFARELGVREPYASSASLFAIAIPTIRMQAGTGYVEVVQLFFMSSAMAFTVRFLRRPAWPAMIAAAAAAGLAAGVKFTFVPLAAPVLALLFVKILARPESVRSKIVWAAAASLAFALMIAPWLWRAYQVTGAPLSPAAIRVFGIELGRPAAEIEAHFALQLPPFQIATEVRRLKEVLIQGYESPGILAVVALLAGMTALPALAARLPAVAALSFLMIATNLAVYYSPGLAVVRHEWPASSIRFLLTALVLGAILSVTPWRRGSRVGRGWLLVLWAGSGAAFAVYLSRAISPLCARGIVALAVAAGLAAIAAASILSRTPRSALRGVVLVAFSVVLLTAVGRLHDVTRPEITRLGFMDQPLRPYWYDAASELDDPGRVRRIAVTSGPWGRPDNWFAYPFMGRRLENEVLYVPVASDGRIHPFGSGEVADEWYRTAEFEIWRERLGTRGVSEVVSFSPLSIELVWMESHPEAFERIDGHPGDWGVFRVKAARPLAAKTIVGPSPAPGE